MIHQHVWKIVGYLQLGLPRLGYAERLIQWHCAGCGETCDLSGDIRLGIPLCHPEWWVDHQVQQQRRQTPEARVARRAKERWHYAQRP